MKVQNNGNGAKTQSGYLQHLPGLYRDDELMGQFLFIFESIMEPLENTVSSLPMYFDPMVTPDSLLEWLAYWVDVALDTTWGIERRRELVKSAAELYRWRGTRRGLAEHLRIYTGTVPEISEHIQGMRLDHDTELGINTQLGSSGAGNHFTVSLKLNKEDEIDINNVRSIIEVQKPAHTVYTLQVEYEESKEG
ncbi:MAG: phage tail protein [Dehalococcoidia bacterium]